MLSISSAQAGAGGEYFSDSNDSLYSGAGDSITSQQQGFKVWLKQQQPHQASVNTGPANSNSKDCEFTRKLRRKIVNELSEKIFSSKIV